MITLALASRGRRRLAKGLPRWPQPGTQGHLHHLHHTTDTGEDTALRATCLGGRGHGPGIQPGKGSNSKCDMGFCLILSGIPRRPERLFDSQGQAHFPA